MNTFDRRWPPKAKVVVGLLFAAVGFTLALFGFATSLFGTPVSTVAFYCGCALFLFGVITIAKALRRSP